MKGGLGSRASGHDVAREDAISVALHSRCARTWSHQLTPEWRAPCKPGASPPRARSLHLASLSPFSRSSTCSLPVMAPDAAALATGPPKTGTRQDGDAEGFGFGKGDLVSLSTPPKFDDVEAEKTYLKTRLALACRIFAQYGLDHHVVRRFRSDRSPEQLAHSSCFDRRDTSLYEFLTTPRASTSTLSASLSSVSSAFPFPSAVQLCALGCSDAIALADAGTLPHSHDCGGHHHGVARRRGHWWR